MKARLKFCSGAERCIDAEVKKENEYTVAYIKKERLGDGVQYVDFLFDCFNAKAGDDGYFITDTCLDGMIRTDFTQRDNCELVNDFSFTACYGWNKGKGGVLAIVTGMRCDFGAVVGVKGGEYYVYPRFYLDGDAPYEDIEVRLYELEDGSYAAMACKYREYQMKERGCTLLKDRVARDPRLKKSADSIAVRMRQGWKPVPSPVEDQSPETEPPLHVACTFDRVGEVADEFKRAGIDNAEFCLVGWNYGGHDGRFPQLFPVDPRLGGEERLTELIKKIKRLGYGIVCHDDATAAYTIADCYDEEYLVKNKTGEPHARPYCWAGGRPYKICPKRQYEKFEISNQEKLKALGFEGLHYIDVITILPLLKCYDKRHPLTKAEAAHWYREIMKLSRKNFGGFSSESSFDFGAAYTDFVLYTYFGIGKSDKHYLCDELVPFWHIVYHGIILYNPCTYTLNYPVKGEKNRLKLIELGGRPLICYYANFAADNNWMGREDFICDTEEQLRESVANAKRMAEDYDLLKDERYEVIVNHEKLKEGVYRTTYSNGTRVTVDYENETFNIEK